MLIPDNLYSDSDSLHNSPLHTKCLIELLKSVSPNIRVSRLKFMSLDEARTLRQKIAEEKNKSRSNFNGYFATNLGLFSGLRIQEMADLIIQDISFLCDWKKIGVYKPFGLDPLYEPFILVRCGKGKKARVVEIGGDLVEIIFEFLSFKTVMGQSIDEGAPLLYSAKSKNRGHYSRSGLYCLIKRGFGSVDERFKALFNTHTLRHTYAVHLYKASGFDVDFVRAQLGHSSIVVTQNYLGTLAIDAKAALTRLRY